MAETNLSKSLKPFIDKDFSMATTLVEVTAKNSPYQGRKLEEEFVREQPTDKFNKRKYK